MIQKRAGLVIMWVTTNSRHKEYKYINTESTTTMGMCLRLKCQGDTMTQEEQRQEGQSSPGFVLLPRGSLGMEAGLPEISRNSPPWLWRLSVVGFASSQQSEEEKVQKDVKYLTWIHVPFALLLIFTSIHWNEVWKHYLPFLHLLFLFKERHLEKHCENCNALSNVRIFNLIPKTYLSYFAVLIKWRF